MNFTITADGEKCKALEKRVSLQLEDESVFSAVVRIENNEIILNKVQIRANVLCCSLVCCCCCCFFSWDSLPHFVFVLSNRLEAEPSSMIYNRIECFYFFLPFTVWNETTRYRHKQSRDSSKVCVIYAFAQECN